MNDMNEPLRLLRKRGHWALEVTKLVAIDRDVLKPERRRVNGTDSVVRHLKERCAPSQVRAALDLIVGDDDGSDRAFELEGEQWIQLQLETSTEASPQDAKLLAMIKDLRIELRTMRALHEAVRERLAVLERRSLQMPPAEYGRAAARGTGRREPVNPSLRPGARSRSTAPAGEAAGPAPQPQAAEDGAPAPGLGEARTQAAGPETSLSPTASDVAVRPLLAMPSHGDIATCLKQLLGADSELRAEKGNIPKDLDGLYVSRVVDSADQEVGAILLDLAGGVELGGRMLGFPLSAIAEQAKSDPSTDMLDAMNEVSNNLGGFINRANPELRVRVRPLEKFSGVELGWLSKNSARVGSTTKTGGRLWITAR